MDQSLRNVSVTRMGTLWQLWDGQITYPSPMTCELREVLDVPADPNLNFHWNYGGELQYWHQHALNTARCHGFGGVTEDCILAPNGVWYHLGMTSIKYQDGIWWATWTGYRNGNLALMLNTGFWAYRDYYPIRWILKNLYRRVRYAIIQRLLDVEDWMERQHWSDRPQQEWDNFLCWLWGHSAGAGHCYRCGATEFTDDSRWPRIGERARSLWNRVIHSQKPF